MFVRAGLEAAAGDFHPPELAGEPWNQTLSGQVAELFRALPLFRAGMLDIRAKEVAAGGGGILVNLVDRVTGDPLPTRVGGLLAEGGLPRFDVGHSERYRMPGNERRLLPPKRLVKGGQVGPDKVADIHRRHADLFEHLDNLIPQRRRPHIDDLDGILDRLGVRHRCRYRVRFVPRLEAGHRELVEGQLALAELPAEFQLGGGELKVGGGPHVVDTQRLIRPLAEHELLTLLGEFQLAGRLERDLAPRRTGDIEALAFLDALGAEVPEIVKRRLVNRHGGVADVLVDLFDYSLERLPFLGDFVDCLEDTGLAAEDSGEPRVRRAALGAGDTWNGLARQGVRQRRVRRHQLELVVLERRPHLVEEDVAHPLRERLHVLGRGHRQFAGHGLADGLGDGLFRGQPLVDDQHLRPRLHVLDALSPRLAAELPRQFPGGDGIRRRYVGGKDAACLFLLGLGEVDPLATLRLLGGLRLDRRLGSRRGGVRRRCGGFRSQVGELREDMRRQRLALRYGLLKGRSATGDELGFLCRLPSLPSALRRRFGDRFGFGNGFGGRYPGHACLRLFELRGRPRRPLQRD